MPVIYQNIKALANAMSDSTRPYQYGYDGTVPKMNSPYSSSAESPSGSMASPSAAVPFMRDEENFTLSFDNQIIALNDTTAMELGSPEIVILDQPVEKFRFRYKSEMMGTHGSLASANSTTRRKRHAPTVQLRHFPGSAIIRCTIVTKNEERRIPHAHHLVKREGNTETDRPYEVEVSAENDWIATFHGMGIIHTAKKHIRDELVKKTRMEALEKHRQIDHTITSLSVREETQIKMDAESAQKWMDLNSVALSFQAFVPNVHGVMCPITQTIYSHVINNLKSALTGELKICRIDKYVSSCDGGEEVFLLVEKVGKKNIKVKFFEVDDKDTETWAAYGRFSELDVHHQYAIVFRTPPYKDRNITSSREVYIQLERPTDGDCSEPMKFTYKPSDSLLGRKRPRISYSESIDFSEPILSDTTMSNNALAFNAETATPSDISAELKKLADEKCDSAEFRAYIENTNIAELFDVAREDIYADGRNYDSDLSTDGPRHKNSAVNGPDFAIGVLKEALKQPHSDPISIQKRFKKMLKERTSYGDTPLHSALRHGKREVAKQILEIMSSSPEFLELVDLENASGKTPLQYAVMLNQPDIVKALLSLGANPNACDNHGSYALHEAVKKPNAWECVDALLEGKADFKLRDDAGWTALQLAAEAGSLNAIMSLVKGGDDVNSSERSYGRTPLHIAVEGGHIEVVRYLLEKTNINVNQRNLGGNTALHTAVVNTGLRAKEICVLLMRHNADPKIPNGHGHSYEKEVNEQEELHTETKIKQEVDDEDDPLEGRTSFELAADNSEIRNLLNEAEKQRNEGGHTEMQTVKSETKEEKSTITEWLDVDQMATLGRILEKNDGWKALAKCLGCDQLSATLESSGASPALTILSYADVHGNLTLQKLFELLHQLKQTEAITFLQDILRSQIN